MSQIENVITTTFRARDGGAIAQMGHYAQGFGQVGRVINDTTRASERLNAQWRAIGTTIRYAVAGGAVFGLTRMVTQLKDVQQQLGLMQAIAQPAGGGIMSNASVDRLGNQLQRAAMRSLTPINEINDATVNLLSTVQNVPQSEIPTMITDIGRAAKLAQTPVEDLTKAATTMNIAFGRPNNAATISQFNRQWFALIKEAPGGVHAAPEIAQQLPQLASMFALGQGPVSGSQSQSQMLSLVLGALRTGATPSTGLRGLTYLLQSIIQPTGKARGALAGIGITPQSIEREGVYKNLMKLLNRVTATGNGKRLAAIPDDQLSAMDESGANLPGIPASEMTRLRQMIPRIHGIRAAVILAGQLRGNNQVLNLQQDLALMDQARNNTVDQTHDMARAWDDFRKRSRLQEAAVSMNTLKLQMAQGLEPLLNFGADRISGIAGAAQDHRRATRNIVLGGAGIAAALGVRRFLGIGRMAGTSLVRANAIQAATSGAAGLGATPQNPLYVVVVGQLFNDSKGQISNNSNAVDKAPGWLKALGVGALAKYGTTIGRGIRGGAGAFGGFAAEMPMLPDAFNWLAHGVDPTTGQRVNNKWWQRALGQGGNFNSSQQYQRALSQAQRMFGRDVTNIESVNKGKLNGQAEIYMTIDLRHPDGTTERRRVHIPAKQWTNGRVPSSRGRAGNTQRN